MKYPTKNHTSLNINIMVYLQIYLVISMVVTYIYLKANVSDGKPIALTSFIFGWVIFPFLIYGLFRKNKN